MVKKRIIQVEDEDADTLKKSTLNSSQKVNNLQIHCIDVISEEYFCSDGEYVWSKEPVYQVYSSEVCKTI